MCTANFTAAYPNANMKRIDVKVSICLSQLQSNLLISLNPKYADYRCTVGPIVVELDNAMYSYIKPALL